MEKKSLEFDQQDVVSKIEGFLKSVEKLPHRFFQEFNSTQPKKEDVWKNFEDLCDTLEMHPYWGAQTVPNLIRNLKNHNIVFDFNPETEFSILSYLQTNTTQIEARILNLVSDCVEKGNRFQLEGYFDQLIGEERAPYYSMFTPNVVYAFWNANVPHIRTEMNKLKLVSRAEGLDQPLDLTGEIEQAVEQCVGKKIDPNEGLYTDSDWGRATRRWRDEKARLN